MNDIAQYQMFKNSFKDGLLYQTNSGAYIRKKIDERPTQLAFNIVNDESKLIKEGKQKLVTTLLKGSYNPNMCILAWYDALSEFATEVINSSFGNKAPLQVLNDWYTKISSLLSSDKQFMEARGKVFDKLKQLYPKTYKSRLKACERTYSTSINKTVADNVKKLLH